MHLYVKICARLTYLINIYNWSYMSIFYLLNVDTIDFHCDFDVVLWCVLFHEAQVVFYSQRFSTSIINEYFIVQCHQSDWIWPGLQNTHGRWLSTLSNLRLIFTFCSINKTCFIGHDIRTELSLSALCSVCMWRNLNTSTCWIIMILFKVQNEL